MGDPPWDASWRSLLAHSDHRHRRAGDVLTIAPAYVPTATRRPGDGPPLGAMSRSTALCLGCPPFPTGRASIVLLSLPDRAVTAASPRVSPRREAVAQR